MAVRRGSARGNHAGSGDSGGGMVARRQLAELLREARERANIRQEDAARYIDRDPSTLHKIETAQPGVRIKPKQDVEDLCGLYGVTDPKTIDSLKALAEATRVKGPFQPYRDVISSNEFDLYLNYEREASSMLAYESDLVLGLLQTEAYIRELTRVPSGGGEPRDKDEVDKRVQLRLKRQNVLTRKQNPLEVDLVLAETVLRRPIGSAQLMADQLRHINTMGELSNITIRIVPYGAGLHQGVISGQFMILGFADDYPSIAYSDAFVGDSFYKEEEAIAKYQAAFEDIRTKAMDPKQSRERIEQAAKELEGL